MRLSESFFNEIVSHPVPLDLTTLKALKRSPLGLDLYLWLVYRTFPLRAPQRISPGSRCTVSSEWPRPKPAITKPFKTSALKVLRELKKIKLAWPDLNYGTARGLLILYPSAPHIPPTPGPGPALISP